MKILVTGFDPFGNENINPAYEAVKALPDSIEETQIIKLQVPTIFEKAPKVLEAALLTYKPDAVICVGQAGGRADITIEKVAINLQEARIPDNEGKKPIDAKVKEDGDVAYFASLPIKAIVRRLQQEDIPASISYTAGTYVCNALLYTLMYLIDKKKLNTIGGFVHVPYIPEQVVSKPSGTPSMSRGIIIEALQLIIKTVAKNTDIQK